MSKVITIFGATGNQGGSVIDAILGDPNLSKEFKVRGITRDTTKKTAQDLVKRGVDVVSVSLHLYIYTLLHFTFCYYARPLNRIMESSWVETNIPTG